MIIRDLITEFLQESMENQVEVAILFDNDDVETTDYEVVVPNWDKSKVFIKVNYKGSTIVDSDEYRDLTDTVENLKGEIYGLKNSLIDKENEAERKDEEIHQLNQQLIYAQNDRY